MSGRYLIPSLEVLKAAGAILDDYQAGSHAEYVSRLTVIFKSDEYRRPTTSIWALNWIVHMVLTLQLNYEKLAASKEFMDTLKWTLDVVTWRFAAYSEHADLCNSIIGDFGRLLILLESVCSFSAKRGSPVGLLSILIGDWRMAEVFSDFWINYRGDDVDVKEIITSIDFELFRMVRCISSSRLPDVLNTTLDPTCMYYRWDNVNDGPRLQRKLYIWKRALSSAPIKRRLTWPAHVHEFLWNCYKARLDEWETGNHKLHPWRDMSEIFYVAMHMQPTSWKAEPMKRERLLLVLKTLRLTDSYASSDGVYNLYCLVIPILNQANLSVLTEECNPYSDVVKELRDSENYGGAIKYSRDPRWRFHMLLHFARLEYYCDLLVNKIIMMPSQTRRLRTGQCRARFHQLQRSAKFTPSMVSLIGFYMVMANEVREPNMGAPPTGGGLRTIAALEPQIVAPEIPASWPDSALLRPDLYDPFEGNLLDLLNYEQ